MEMEQDAERLLLLQKILDLLLAGGYFRARISSLSPFDKLTGGLAWCITASNVDVDFDIFYDDDATLGYKIKVGEAIEAALQKMQCPYPLQAHQIQGLDYQAVYPVVQWLLRRLLTTREMLADQLRRHSHFRFHGNYELPEETALQMTRQDKTRTRNNVISNQRPQRLYRRARNIAAPLEKADRVRCTLLEYGHFFPSRVQATLEKQDSSLVSQNLSETDTSVWIHPLSSSASDRGSYSPTLEGSLSALSFSEDGSLTSSKLGKILGLRSEEIRAAVSQYSHSNDAQLAHQKQVVSILKQIEGEERHKEQLQDQNKDTSVKTLKIKDNCREQEERQVELLSEVDMLYRRVAEAGVGDTLQKLLPLVEQLKLIQEEEVNFCSSCKKQHNEMLAHLANLESQVDHFKDGDDYQAEIDEALSSDQLKLNLLKGDISKANQKVFLLHRKLDDTPSQTELMQYERCFVELYLHIQAKLRETRKYYAMYNALAEANELTLKETSLLNSINVQFETAMMSPEGRINFVTSMSDISKGVQQKLEKMETKLQGEQRTLSALREQHAQIVAARRHYVNLIKIFQEECAKNETLRSASAQHSSNL